MYARHGLEDGYFLKEAHVILNLALKNHCLRNFRGQILLEDEIYSLMFPVLHFYIGLFP